MPTKAIQVYDGSGERFILPRQGRYFEHLEIRGQNVGVKYVDELRLCWEIHFTDPDESTCSLIALLETYLAQDDEVRGGTISVGAARIDEKKQGFIVKGVQSPVSKDDDFILCLEFLPF